ncbi:MAG: serine hydrolase [Caldilineaceae bacterium]|nr:serine hydrolase [Caldilineaceae bacterium]
MRRFLTFVVTLCAILALFPVYSRFKVAAAPVPPGVYLGGLSLSDLKDLTEIRHHLEGIYSQTIVVSYAGQQMPLPPEDVDFHIDVEQMVAEASQYLEGAAFLDIAVREAFGFPQQRRDIPVRFTMNTNALRAWLEGIAAEQDRPPQGARVLSASMQLHDGLRNEPSLPTGYVGGYWRDWGWQPGAPGYTLDVDTSVDRVAAALTRTGERVAELALIETPPPPVGMDDLARAIDNYFADFPGFAAAYVYDPQAGEAARIDDEVSFSGMSTLKLFIVAAVMRELPDGITADDPTARQVGQWIDYALGESNNYAANQLLAFLGDGNSTAGARRVTEFARRLGFVNTYMQSGFDAPKAPQIPTPGNQRTDWSTNPDSNLQTTPLEMGQMMTALYECAMDTGLLRAAYPDDITAEECRQILFYMTHDQFMELLWGGLPGWRDAWIIHKHGFAFESHSDVALIWGPTGPYVVSVFLFRQGWMDWGTSNSTIKGVSRLTWRFFEFQRSQGAGPPPDPIVLAPPPGYVKIVDYVPTAAKPSSD